MNGNRQRTGTLIIIGGVVLGIVLALATSSWFWVAIGAGVGTAIGASMYPKRGGDDTSGPGGDRPTPTG